MYANSGLLVNVHQRVAGSSALMTGTLDSPLGFPDGMVGMTIHCLVLNGASLDRIEVLWQKP